MLLHILKKKIYINLILVLNWSNKLKPRDIYSIGVMLICQSLTFELARYGLESGGLHFWEFLFYLTTWKLSDALAAAVQWTITTFAFRWGRGYGLSICVEVCRSTRVPVTGNETGRLVKFEDLCRKWINKSETWHILRRDIAAASLKIWCEHFNPVKS